MSNATTAEKTDVAPSGESPPASSTVRRRKLASNTSEQNGSIPVAHFIQLNEKADTTESASVGNSEDSVESLERQLAAAKRADGHGKPLQTFLKRMRMKHATVVELSTESAEDGFRLQSGVETDLRKRSLMARMARISLSHRHRHSEEDLAVVTDEDLAKQVVAVAETAEEGNVRKRRMTKSVRTFFSKLKARIASDESEFETETDEEREDGQDEAFEGDVELQNEDKLEIRQRKNKKRSRNEDRTEPGDSSIVAEQLGNVEEGGEGDAVNGQIVPGERARKSRRGFVGKIKEQIAEQRQAISAAMDRVNAEIKGTLDDIKEQQERMKAKLEEENQRIVGNIKNKIKQDLEVLGDLRKHLKNELKEVINQIKKEIMAVIHAIMWKVMKIVTIVAIFFALAIIGLLYTINTAVRGDDELYVDRGVETLQRRHLEDFELTLQLLRQRHLTDRNNFTNSEGSVPFRRCANEVDMCCLWVDEQCADAAGAALGEETGNNVNGSLPGGVIVGVQPVCHPFEASFNNESLTGEIPWPELDSKSRETFGHREQFSLEIRDGSLTQRGAVGKATARTTNSEACKACTIRPDGWLAFAITSTRLLSTLLRV